MSDGRNPTDVHTLTLSHRGPPPACGAALVARQAEIYRIQSASFRTSGKEIVTRFGDLHIWPGSMEAAILPHRRYLIAKKDFIAPRLPLPSRYEFPLSARTGTFSRPLSGSYAPFRSFSAQMARAKREKGNSDKSQRFLLGLVAASVL